MLIILFILGVVGLLIPAFWVGVKAIGEPSNKLEKELISRYNSENHWKYKE